jgi:anti-sigma B factor antagonist
METEILFSDGSNLPACETSPEECQLSLLLERIKCGDAVVLRCRGRIVYRAEAAVLSRAVSELLEHNRQIILDLSGVSAIDSAGLGELVALHLWAQGNGSCLKLVGLSSRIFHLLELTNLTSLFQIFATEKAALESWQQVA